MAERKLLITSKSKVIRSVDDWFKLAPPKGGEDHWQGGKSAKELAKAWFRTGVAVVPVELQALLDSSAATVGAKVTSAKPEHETRFDTYGTGRSHDLLLKMRRGDDLIIAGIEGKAGESLDKLVLQKHDDGVAIRDGGKNTNLPERVEELVTNLFGRALDEDVHLGQLRYQLLTATGGTLVEAKQQGAIAALVIVHELVRRSESASVTPTQRAITDFIRAFDQVDVEPFITPGTMYGPLSIAGGGWLTREVPLHVALIERDVALVA